MSPDLFDSSEDENKAAARAAYLRQVDMGTQPKGHTEQQWDRVYKWVNENRAILIRVGNLSAVVDGLRKRTRKVTCRDGGDVDLPRRPRGCGPIEINSLVQAAAQAGSGLVVVQRHHDKRRGHEH